MVIDFDDFMKVKTGFFGASDFLLHKILQLNCCCRHEQFGFFDRYNSPKDFAYRSASIVISPILYLARLIFLFVKSVYKLLMAVGGAFVEDFTEVEQSILQAPHLFILTAVLSPFINLIDVLVGAVYSLQHLLAGADENRGGVKPVVLEADNSFNSV